jgi:peptidoglycan/LPS O-acetylase OafA/YrhL
VGHHVSPLPWPGHSAIVVFFVLSGFVITHAVNKPGTTLRHYVTHRLLRIMPVTILALLLSVALAAYAGQCRPARRRRAGDLDG